MPKTNTKNSNAGVVEEKGKIIEIEGEEKSLDEDLMPEEEVSDESDEDSLLDEDEVNPFGDKWEE